jgi:hypothetical protein
MNNRQQGSDDVARQPGDELLNDLPDVEEDQAPQPPFDLDDNELMRADREGQIELMREWFLARYCDPAEETPYESREGGYIWIWGGPYDADEELQGRFSHIVEDDVIEELVDDLNSDGGYQWAPVRRDDDRDYEDLFGLDLDQPVDPLTRLQERLAGSISVLSLEGAEPTMEHLARMAFGAAISALEAYLWETVAYWAKSNPEVLKGIVKNIPELRDQPIKLGDVFDEHEGIEARVMLYLQNLVWHRFDKAAMLLRHGLGINPPSFKPFKEALAKRHDIVHRSGHDTEGNAVVVTAQDARELAAAVEEFASKVYAAIVEKLLPSQTEESDDPF